VNAATHGASDPVSHQPELKAAAVRIEPVDDGRTDVAARLEGRLRDTCPADPIASRSA
jgi:hypothetical protein